MSVYLALMAMVGQLTVTYLLGYPVAYLAEHLFGRPFLLLEGKRWEWETGHRD